MRLWTAFLALVWAIVNVHALDESDAFWHAAFGREIARHHTRTFAEPFSFVADTARSQEWLWDLSTYALVSRFDWDALAVLVIVLAALAALAVAFAAWTWRTPDDERPLGALIATTALVSPAILSRIRERPETMAMLLLPLLLAFGHRLAAAREPRARTRAAIAVFVTQLLFVQCHPSFVLGPIVIAIVAGPELALGSRHARATGAALIAGTALSFLTNVPALAAVFRHQGGYAVEHITDMQPPVWEYVNPARSPLVSTYFAIGVAAALAMAKARRVFVRPLLLALVGAVIALRFWRGIGPGAVFAIPLAMASFAELLAGARDKTLAVVVGALFVLGRNAQWVDASTEGGLGILGLDAGAYPFAGARALEAAPPGTRVLTTYDSGAPIGYLLDGRVRTFVDSRTPLVFGDTAYGEARALWTRGDTLGRATESFHFEAAVVERDGTLCPQLGEHWNLIALEPRFATFARSFGAPLTSFDPCNPIASVKPDACKDAGKLAADLDAIAKTASPGYARYLRARAITECSDPFDADAVVALLEPRRAALGFFAERDGLLAWVYAKANREEQVRALTTPHLGRAWGNANADPMLPALRALAPTASARDLFELAYAAKGDNAPGWLEAKLAQSCMADEDRACVELHAFRAAVLGYAPVTPALCWLGGDEAARWVEVFHQSCP